MDKTLLITAVVAHTALWHNNQHYPVGAKIEVTESEFEKLAYYLKQEEGESVPKVKAGEVDIAEEARAIDVEIEAGKSQEETEEPAETVEVTVPEEVEKPTETAEDTAQEDVKSKSKKAQ